MKISYDVFHFYSSDLRKDEVYGESYKSVTTSDPEIVGTFMRFGKLYVGACLIGCKLTKIETN